MEELGQLRNLLSGVVKFCDDFWEINVRKDWLVVADTIRPSDVGLGDVEQQNRGFGDDGQGEWRSILPRWAPPISYLHLYECELFSVRNLCSNQVQIEVMDY